MPSAPKDKAVNGKAAMPYKRQTNAELRSREWLEEDEVKQLGKAAREVGRHGHRDATMILVGYRHGLRCTELVNLKWDQINLDQETCLVRRVKGSRDSMHTLERDEIKALRGIGRFKLGADRHGYVFRTERGGPVSERSFHGIVARAGRLAGFSFPVHPHMLRHACGHSLINRDVPIRVVQDWLGHANINHTVAYAQLSPERFRRERIWSGTRSRN
jgi:site-specific recombinase XerD